MVIHLNNTGGSILIVNTEEKECEHCLGLRLEDILATLPNACFYRC